MNFILFAQCSRIELDVQRVNALVFDAWIPRGLQVAIRELTRDMNSQYGKHDPLAVRMDERFAG